MTDHNLQDNENEEVVDAKASATELVKSTTKKEKEIPKKVGFLTKVGKYFKDTKSEVKKVVWPTKSQILNNTLVVIVMIAIIGAFIGLLDFGFTKGLEFILSLV